MELKAISLVGTSKIYISKSNKNPSKIDYDHRMLFERWNTQSFHSIHKAIWIFTKDIKNDFMYINIEADSYTVIDLIPSLMK